MKDIMDIVKDNRMCEICRSETAVVFCDGCGRALCEECRIFDMWSYGCGHIDTKAFCKNCHENPEKNPWGGARSE